MQPSLRLKLRTQARRSLRGLFRLLPQPVRFELYRAMVDVDPTLDERFELKIADTLDELEACFRLLHDAYVGVGLMRPDPSGMRITPYHALPTTTTLCVKFEGRVIATVSIIREGAFGLPLQTIFDVTPVRANGGVLGEVSALAVHPDFRHAGGIVLFSIIHFLVRYCNERFDTRHMLIAVNPDSIELYESLLLFQRLPAPPVNEYEFANGQAVVGATLDLWAAPERLRRVFSGRHPRQDLYQFFVLTPHTVHLPRRRYHTLNDPVMSPALLQHFFCQVSRGLDAMGPAQLAALRAIYADPAYDAVLPPVPAGTPAHADLGPHPAFLLRMPCKIKFWGHDGLLRFDIHVVQLARSSFVAESRSELPFKLVGDAVIELGPYLTSYLKASVTQQEDAAALRRYRLEIVSPDDAWLRCHAALTQSRSALELLQAP